LEAEVVEGVDNTLPLLKSKEGAAFESEAPKATEGTEPKPNDDEADDDEEDVEAVVEPEEKESVDGEAAEKSVENKELVATEDIPDDDNDVVAVVVAVVGAGVDPKLNDASVDADEAEPPPNEIGAAPPNENPLVADEAENEEVEVNDDDDESPNDSTVGALPDSEAEADEVGANDDRDAASVLVEEVAVGSVAAGGENKGTSEEEGSENRALGVEADLVNTAGDLGAATAARTRRSSFCLSDR
jgi:hypothetical protein